MARSVIVSDNDALEFKFAPIRFTERRRITEATPNALTIDDYTLDQKGFRQYIDFCVNLIVLYGV